MKSKVTKLLIPRNQNPDHPVDQVCPEKGAKKIKKVNTKKENIHLQDLDLLIERKKVKEDTQDPDQIHPEENPKNPNIEKEDLQDLNPEENQIQEKVKMRKDFYHTIEIKFKEYQESIW